MLKNAMIRLLIVSGCCFAALSGCAANQVVVEDPEVTAFVAGKPDALKRSYRLLKTEGKRNEVLNYMRMGVDAYRSNDRDEARNALNKVLLGIETVYANNEGAQKARTLWYEEGMKDFKGEPYERVMAYYYRGLLYLEDADFENARASFKSAIIQDSFAEEEQYRCDFALVIFMEALASQLAGDAELAKPAYNELAKFRPDFKLNEKPNVLFIIETGTSPRKVSDGPGHSELKYRRGKNFTEKRAEITIGSQQAVLAYPMEDILFQASSRGGRQIDKVLKDKVVFRETNLEMGSALSDVARTTMLMAPLANIGGSAGAMGAVQGVAGGLAVIGAVQQLIAINAKPQADTRYWDNLPDTVHVMAASLPQGSHSAKVRFLDEANKQVIGLDKSVRFDVNGTNKLTLVWVRSR